MYGLIEFFAQSGDFVYSHFHWENILEEIRNICMHCGNLLFNQMVSFRFFFHFDSDRTFESYVILTLNLFLKRVVSFRVITLFRWKTYWRKLQISLCTTV